MKRIQMMTHSEYLSYFNLASDPFSREIDTEQLLTLPSIEQYMGSAELLIETRGIGVVTGKSGTGKSTLLRLLIDRLQPGLYKSYYVCHTSVGLVEFYTHLCSVFGLTPGHRRASMFRAIKEHVLTMHSSSRIHPGDTVKFSGWASLRIISYAAAFSTSSPSLNTRPAWTSSSCCHFAILCHPFSAS